MAILNRVLLAYIAAPTPKGWAEVMRVILPFDPSLDYTTGTLVTVGAQLFRLERAPRSRMRARRFNRKALHFNRNSLSLEHFKRYVEQHTPSVPHETVNV